MIDVEINGLEELMARFSETPRLVQREFDARANQGLNEARRRLTRYPPPRPNQTYVRTFKLRQGWSDTPVQRDLYTRALVNPVPYVPEVQGDESQARVHAGRWRTVGAIARDLDIQSIADQAAEDIARKLGG